MIRIFDTVADFRKKPESSGNAVSCRNLKRECITLINPFPTRDGERVIHSLFRFLQLTAFPLLSGFLRKSATVSNILIMTSIYLSVRIYRILRYGALIPLLSAWLTLPEDGRDTDGEAFTNRKLLLHLFALYILQIILLKL